MLECSRLKMPWWFQADSKGTQSYIYTYPFSPNSPPIPAATWHWAEFPGLSSRPLLVLHVKHSCVSMSIPDSLTIPSPILPPGDHQVITEYWADFPGLDNRSLLILHVKHSSVYTSIPNSLTTSSPHLFLPEKHKAFTEYWTEFPTQQVLVGYPC